MRRRLPLWGAGATALAVAPLLALAAPSAPGGPPAPGPPPADARAAALAAAAGWRDTLAAYRAPQIHLPPGDRVVVLVLEGPPSALAPPGGRAAAAEAIAARQDALAASLESVGAEPLQRYRVLLNGMAVRVPAGRLPAVAALADVRAVVPVSLLAPAQAAEVEPGAAATAGAAPVAGAPGRPAHLALIDGPVDAAHPALGGGLGPTFPIIGGADLVDGDGDPRADPLDPDLAEHGTGMAGIVLGSPALQGLAPERTPRLLAYRVLARESVAGTARIAARSDRVLEALERAADPDGDGDPRDRAEVILLGLAAGFDGAGTDPIALALAAADRAGATVVVPAGNDGPTFSRPGGVGGPATAPTAITVGGTSGGAAPRAADLRIAIGPAEVGLGPLPLMGPAPPPASLPVVVLGGAGLPLRGDLAEPWILTDPAPLRGAAVVVARGEDMRAAAARAAAAGAAALVVWDPSGPAGFPGIAAPELALPVVGLGPAQGEALMRLAEERPGLGVTIAPRPREAAEPRLASFSSWGPTADGRPKPEVVADAVDVPAPLPGGDAGAPRGGAMNGTSAAAARVAAQALRLRVDRPGLGPGAVRSAVVQAARPLPGVPAAGQGAGAVAGGPLPVPAVALDPAVVTPRPDGRTATVAVTVADLSGEARAVRVSLRAEGFDRVLGAPRRMAAGGRLPVRARVPAGVDGRLVVTDPDGTELGGAPLVTARPAATAPDAIGTPQVRVASGVAEVLVRIGVLERRAARVRVQRPHDVRVALVPADGGAPLPVGGLKEGGDGAPGTYRIVVGRRLADGLEAPPGDYRLRVRATGPDGSRLRRESAPFTLG